MSKMSQLHAELSEQASELGFESIEEAEANGYHIAYDGTGWKLKLDMAKAYELARKDWEKERDDLLARADEVWENPNHDDLLELVSDLVAFIKKGEV